MKKQFGLIENAKESLEHAVDHLTRVRPVTPGDLKRAILDVTHVIELLLKEALYRVHPALIWEKIDEYPDEEKRTVSTELAVQRLEKIGKIKLSKENLEGIKTARKIRNNIEHYKFVFEEKETRLVIGKLLSMIFDFSKKRLALNWEDEFRKSRKWPIVRTVVKKPLRH